MVALGAPGTVSGPSGVHPPDGASAKSPAVDDPVHPVPTIGVPDDEIATDVTPSTAHRDGTRASPATVECSPTGSCIARAAAPPTR